jgi:F0F1-type ATP synthase membrane subunit c/vacuolar-type H+-ATPase subunit K
MLAVPVGVVSGVGLAVTVGDAVPVGILTVTVGGIAVPVGGIVEGGLVVAGLQATSRNVANKRMDKNLFIGILLFVRSSTVLETSTKDYILKIAMLFSRFLIP